ncbi:CPBP family intramembrane glutamic endopeptidase [Liquorilactobacillus satsumensis]|uniref:CPBP family intramembrane glutamic endopeptidase n=1 Tax=Liquorilactobacillus satsumensis TaxID=259059 RepID=UPI001E4C6C3C|nr:type II CAAX endopeptidase family protein [Liquorilactobacillus satsumensis]MCC7666078.1 CPBP family intramembrane metalloprotease domain-containing protein [Liquorilactobacillus satsumensis]MCP9356815.1 CPBP family intramembrane metalloprotease [Liquorilactobacillus satsumensis]MCP9370755.1 CPBP family intramembrane metalloprotease [Liquorilactobacillus satsumensis]
MAAINNSAKKKFQKKLGKTLLVTAIYFVVFQVVALIASVFLLIGNNSAVKNMLPSAIEQSGVPYFWAIGVGLLVIVAVSPPRLRRQYWIAGKEQISWKKFFSLTAILMTLQIVAGIYGALFEKLVNLIGFSATQQLEAATHSSQSFSMLLYAALLGPLTEEIVFRGYLLRSLAKYGNEMAIIISAYMFGLYHANFVQTPFAFMVGLVFGYVALNYGIKWSIGLHIFNNFVLGDFLTFVLRRLAPARADQLSGIIILGGGIIGAYILARNWSKLRMWWAANREGRHYLRTAFGSKYLLIITLIVVGLACLGLTRV